MDINPYQHVVDTTMHEQRLNIYHVFKRFLGYEDEVNMFDCYVENEATLSLLEKYYVDQMPLRIRDDATKINYSSEGADNNVCVRLSKILTWFYLGYNPRLYKHDQIILAYRMIRNVLDVYREDSTSLVSIEMPDEIRTRIVELMERLEKYFQDVINPTIDTIDKPISTFLDKRFAGLFGNNNRQPTIRSDNRIVKNGFVLNEEEQDLMNQFEDSILQTENKWE